MKVSFTPCRAQPQVTWSRTCPRKRRRHVRTCVRRTAFFLSSVMSKRGPDGTRALKTRKRRKNGISTSSSVLDPVDTPPDKPQVMRIWNTNAEDPTTSRQSTVPIPSEPQIKEQNTEAGGGDFEAIAPASRAIPVKSKRRTVNDSVSPNPNDSNSSYDFQC
jgi:hypothetical protein